MCCFARPVKDVSNTHLFARLSSPKTQLLAYQMTYESEQLNAMILPVPVATPTREDSLRFISLKGYDRFFDDLKRGFPTVEPASPKPMSRAKIGAINSKMLVVHEVGDFEASFVPTMDDFDRLDPRFVIPKSSWDKIPHYSNYGFAVFQLKQRSGKPHPMAFEFETRLASQIFFPTVHIHDGEVHNREKFDHMLYLQCAQYDQVVGDYVNSHVADKSTGFVRSVRPAKTFVDTKKSQGMIDGNLMVHRKRMKGMLKNKDILATTKPTKRKGGFGMLEKSCLPGLAGILGLSWIIQRRDRLADLKE